MLTYVFLFGLLLGACYWILTPLLREDGRQKGFIPKSRDILKELKSKKDGAYAAIRELEFDLSMGKLTDEDFQILKQQYALEAVGYMKEIDKLQSPKTANSRSVDSDLEKEIEQEAAAVDTPESTKRKFIYCTSCGEKAAVESRFCSACGSKLHKNAKNRIQEEN